MLTKLLREDDDFVFIPVQVPVLFRHYNSVIPAPPPTRTAVSSYAGDGEAASGVKNNKKKGWMMRWEYDDVIKEEKRRRYNKREEKRRR